MFEARDKYSLSRDALEEDLMRACGIDPEDYKNWPHEDFTFDDYDNSFEFKGVKNDWTPTEKQLAGCWALGFSRCWICYKDATMKRTVLRPDGFGGMIEVTAQGVAHLVETGLLEEYESC